MRDVDGGRRIYEIDFLFFFFLFLFRAIGGVGRLKFLRERLVWVKSGNFTLYVLMQMIVGVELRHIYGCIVGTLCTI